MTYELIIAEEAQSDLAKLKRNEPAAFKKATRLFLVLQEHPIRCSDIPHIFVTQEIATIR